MDGRKERNKSTLQRSRVKWWRRRRTRDGRRWMREHREVCVCSCMCVCAGCCVFALDVWDEWREPPHPGARNSGWGGRKVSQISKVCLCVSFCVCVCVWHRMWQKLSSKWVVGQKCSKNWKHLSYGGASCRERKYKLNLPVFLHVGLSVEKNIQNSDELSDSC